MKTLIPPILPCQDIGFGAQHRPKLEHVGTPSASSSVRLSFLLLSSLRLATKLLRLPGATGDGAWSKAVSHQISFEDLEGQRLHPWKTLCVSHTVKAKRLAVMM